TKKSGLKKELYDAVYANDAKNLNFLFKPMKALAANQAARLAELDTLAEGIRHGLSDLANARVAWNHPQLPAGLGSDADRMVAKYLAAQKEPGVKMDRVADPAKGLSVWVNHHFERDLLKYEITFVFGQSAQNREGATPNQKRQMESLRSEVA